MKPRTIQVGEKEQNGDVEGQEQLVLVGHSYGAFLASLYAAEFPEHVRALVLVAPADLLTMPIEGGGLFEQVGARLPSSKTAEFAEFLSRYLDMGAVFDKTDEQLVALQLEFVEYYAAATGIELATESVARSAGGFMVWAQYFGMGQRHDYRDAVALVLDQAKGEGSL